MDYKLCPEGEYCKQGAAYGTVCSILEVCPIGSPVPLASSAGPTLLLSFIGFFFILFKLQESQVNKEMSKENQEMEDYLETYREAIRKRRKPPPPPSTSMIMLEYLDASGVGGWWHRAGVRVCGVPLFLFWMGSSLSCARVRS